VVRVRASVRNVAGVLRERVRQAVTDTQELEVDGDVFGGTVGDSLILVKDVG
jgi:hypothetical protein